MDERLEWLRDYDIDPDSLGKAASSGWTACNFCEGSGRVGGEGTSFPPHDCPECRGTGIEVEGQGYPPVNKDASVDEPLVPNCEVCGKTFGWCEHTNPKAAEQIKPKQSRLVRCQDCGKDYDPDDEDARCDASNGAGYHWPEEIKPKQSQLSDHDASFEKFGLDGRCFNCGHWYDDHGIDDDGYSDGSCEKCPSHGCKDRRLDDYEACYDCKGKGCPMCKDTGILPPIRKPRMDSKGYCYDCGKQIILFDDDVHRCDFSRSGSATKIPRYVLCSECEGSGCEECKQSGIMSFGNLDPSTQDCIKDGIHLTSCDEDGYCNYCGDQEGAPVMDDAKTSAKFPERQWGVCPPCKGSGVHPKYPDKPCYACDGAGLQLIPEPCTTCYHTRLNHDVNKSICYTCQENGDKCSGYVKQGKTRLVMPARCPNCESTETRGRYHRGGWREYICLDCGSEFKNRDSKIAGNLEVAETIPCMRCDYSGKCLGCKGTGINENRFGPDASEHCPECRGSGLCGNCKGSGIQQWTKKEEEQLQALVRAIDPRGRMSTVHEGPKVDYDECWACQAENRVDYIDGGNKPCRVCKGSGLAPMCSNCHGDVKRISAGSIAGPGLHPDRNRWIHSAYEDEQACGHRFIEGRADDDCRACEGSGITGGEQGTRFIHPGTPLPLRPPVASANDLWQVCSWCDGQGASAADPDNDCLGCDGSGLRPNPRQCEVCGEEESHNPSFEGLHKYGPGDHVFVPKEGSKDRQTSWHLTDDPNFKLDPNKNPANNTTLGGDWPHKGLFVDKDPERWFNGHDYVRPFVAEIEHPDLKSMGGYMGENFLPAEQFPESTVKRVIPWDEHCRETFHEYGHIEDYHGTDSQGQPLPEVGEGELSWRRPGDLSNYHYEGPDVRDMTPEQQQRHIDRTKAYTRALRPHMYDTYNESGELVRAKPKYKKIAKRGPKVTFVQGDITKQDTDAIVNAANEKLLGGGGVDHAIHQAAGPELLEHCKALRETDYPDGIVAGQAVVTPAGNLPAKYVIHAVGPRYKEHPNPAEALRSAHTESLKRADEVGAKSVAFPAISTGIFGYPLKEASKIAVDAVRSADTNVEEVRFVSFDDKTHAAFSKQAASQRCPWCKGNGLMTNCSECGQPVAIAIDEKGKYWFHPGTFDHSWAPVYDECNICDGTGIQKWAIIMQAAGRIKYDVCDECEGRGDCDCGGYWDTQGYHPCTGKCGECKGTGLFPQCAECSEPLFDWTGVSGVPQGWHHSDPPCAFWEASESKYAHVGDDAAAHHSNPDKLRQDHPYWDTCPDCGGDGIAIGSTDVTTGEQKQKPCATCKGIGEAHDFEYWDSDDQLHDFSNYPTFREMDIPDKELKKHLKDVHEQTDGYDDAYIHHQTTHGVNVDPDIAAILIAPKKSALAYDLCDDCDGAGKNSLGEKCRLCEGTGISLEHPRTHECAECGADLYQDEHGNFVDGADYMFDNDGNMVATDGMTCPSGYEKSDHHVPFKKSSHKETRPGELHQHQTGLEVCDHCDGTGRYNEASAKMYDQFGIKPGDRCGKCKGSGLTEEWGEEHLGPKQAALWEPCFECNGSGFSRQKAREDHIPAHEFEPNKYGMCVATLPNGEQCQFGSDFEAHNNYTCKECHGAGLMKSWTLEQNEASFRKEAPYGMPKDIGGDTPEIDARMERCVKKVMKQGHDKKSAIRICKASIEKKERKESGTSIPMMQDEYRPIRDQIGEDTKYDRELRKRYRQVKMEQTEDASEDYQYVDPGDAPDEDDKMKMSKTAEFTPGDVTYPFAENATPKLNPQPRGEDPWKDRGDNGIPLHNPGLKHKLKRKMITDEQATGLGEINYPGNGLMSEAAVELDEGESIGRCSGCGKTNVPIQGLPEGDRFELCGWCNGTGTENGRTCLTCKGSGLEKDPPSYCRNCTYGAPAEPQIMTCGECGYQWDDFVDPTPSGRCPNEGNHHYAKVSHTLCPDCTVGNHSDCLRDDSCGCYCHNRPLPAAEHDNGFGWVNELKVGAAGEYIICPTCWDLPQVPDHEHEEGLGRDPNGALFQHLLDKHELDRDKLPEGGLKGYVIGDAHLTSHGLSPSSISGGYCPTCRGAGIVKTASYALCPFCSLTPVSEHVIPPNSVVEPGMTHNNPEGNWTPDDVEAHLYKAHGLPSWADPPWGQRDYFKWSELHRMGHGHAPQRGYCPACKGSGLVNDPSGRIDQMNQVEDLLKQGGKRKWDTWHGDVIKGEPLCDYCLHPEGIHDDRCTGGGGENGRCECLNGYKLNYPVDWGIKRSKTPLEEFRSLHYDVEPDDYDWEDEEQWNSLGPVDPDQYRMCPSCKGAGCENCKQSGLLGKPTEAEQPSIFKDPNRDYSLPHLKIYKKAQTWNQGNGGELDRVPPNPDVKRKPYDPYPNEGDTGEAVLPPPTGDDIKKWKTIKTFPGDKPFADHPLYQSPDDVNKGQVVGSAADDDLTTKTPAEIDAEYFPLASEHNRNLETSLKYQQYANDPKTRDYDRKRYRGYVEEYRNKADEIKAQMAPHEAEFQRRGGWNRYMLCASDGGHMHRADPICHTLTPGKSRVSMIPEASGLDDEGLVAKYGYSACTHCFKEAPTHPAWQQGEAEAQAAEKAKLDARCPASGTHYTKHNITLPEGYWQRYVRPGIRCPECGGRTVLTDTGKLRAHKPPKTSAKRVTNIDKITNYLLNYDTSQGTAHEPGADKAPNCRTCDSRHSDLTIDAAPRGDWRVDGTQGTEIDAENLAYWIPKENKHSLRYSPAAAIHTWGDSKGPGDIVHQEGFDEPSTPFSIKVLWNPYMHERDHATMNLLHEAGHYMQAKNDWDSFWDHSRGVGLHSDPDYERDAFEKGLDVARAAGVRVTSRMREQWKWSVGGEHLASKERKYAPCEFCEGSGQLPTCSMCGTNDIGTCRIGCNEEGPLVNCDGCKGSGLMLAWNPKSSAVREKNVRCPKCKEKHDPSDACAKIEQEQLPLWDKQAGFEWINEFQATSVFHNCSRCLGTGKATWCYTCGGAGDYVMRTDLDHDPRTVPCYNCNGTGQDDRLCEKCKGSGLTRTAANESDRTCNICGQQMEEDDDVCPFCLNGATDEAIEREAAKHAGWKSCYWCDGSGTSPDCAGCSGTGERWNDWEQSILACPFCKGSGDNPADSMRCQLCNGSGLEKETSKQALFDYDPVRDVNPSSTRSAPAPSPQGQSRDPWRDPRNKLAPPRQSGGQKRALLDYDPVRDVSPGSNKSAPAPSATKPVGDPWHDEADNGIDQQRPGFIFDPKLKKWVKDLQGTYPEIGPTFPGVTDINKVGAHYWGYDKCNVCNGEGCAECKGSGLQGRECPGCGGTGEVFKCPECSWANAALDEEDRECPNCGVERELVPCDEDDEDAKFQRNAKTEMEQCDHCDGSGTRSGERCEFCSGSGIVPSIDDMSQIAEFKCRECGTHYNDEGHDWEYGDLYCPGCGGHYEIDGIRQMPKQSHKQEGYAQCWQCGFGAAGCNECRGTGLVPDRPIHHALNHLKDEGYNVRDMSGSYGRMFTITPYDQRKGEDHTPGLQFGHSDDDGWYARFYSDDPGGDPEREEYRDAIREGYPHLGQCDQDPDFAGPDQWQGNDHDEMHYKKFDPHDMVGFVHKMHDKYKDELGAIKKQGSIVVGAAYNWIRWNEDRAGGTYLVTAAACPWHMREASTREGFDKIRTHGVKLCHFCGKSDPVNEVKIAEKQTAIQPCFQCDGTGLDPHTIDNSMCTLCKGSGIINLLEKGFLERAPEKVREELLNKFASGSMGSVSGYVYDSDVHCEDCAYERFGDKLDTDEAEDSSGEPPSPIMSYDDWETPSTCGTCGKPFCTVCGSNGGSFKDKEDCERCEGAGKTEEVKAKPPRWELCHGCDGAGNKNCYCKGSGIVHMPEQEHVPSQPCPDCKGQGTFDNVYECGNCGTKSGYIENEGFQYLSKKAQVERDLCVRCEGEGCQACQQSGIRAVPMDLRPLHRHLLLQHGDVDDLGQLDMMNDEQLEFTHKDWHRDEEEFLDGEPNDHPYEKIGQAFPQQPGDHQADNGIEDPVKDTKKTWLKKIVPDTTETLPGNNEMNVSIDNMPKTGEKTKGLPEGRCHGVRDQSLRCWTPALPGGMYCEMHQADMDERKREMDDHFDNHREAYFPGCDRCDGDRELDVALGRPIKPEHQASKTGQAHDPQPDAEDDQEAQQQQPSDLAMHVVQSHPQMAEELDLIDALDQFTDMELDELHIEDHMAGANDHLPETLRVAKVAMMYETGYCPECKTIEPTTVDGKCDTCGTELPDAWDTDHFDGKTR